MRIQLGVLMALLALCLLPCDVDAKVYQTYFLGGQSNMEGFGYTKDLPAELRAPLKGVMIFHGNTAPDGAAAPDGRGVWAELRPGHGVGFSSDGKTNAYTDRFGLELTFARRLREADPAANIAIIKYARGGTSIDAAAAGNFGSWEPDYNTGSGINQYDHFLATLRNATRVSDIDGDGTTDILEPAGLLWMQGESDGGFTEEIARRYQAHLKRLMDLMRAAFRVDDLPVVIGRITDSRRDADGRVWDHGEIIRRAQADYVKADGRAALVTSTEEYGYSDKWHYDSRGYLDLGRRFAEALLSLKRPANDSPSTPRPQTRARLTVTASVPAQQP